MAVSVACSPPRRKESARTVATTPPIAPSASRTGALFFPDHRRERVPAPKGRSFALREKSRSGAQAAFFTRPARMHAAQTRICFFAPFTNPRTRRKFGFHRRRRVLFAWLITFPKCGPLPHNSHFIAIIFLFNAPKIFKNASHHSSRPRPLFPLATHISRRNRPVLRYANANAPPWSR